MLSTFIFASNTSPIIHTADYSKSLPASRHQFSRLLHSNPISINWLPPLLVHAPSVPTTHLRLSSPEIRVKTTASINTNSKVNTIDHAYSRIDRSQHLLPSYFPPCLSHISISSSLPPQKPWCQPPASLISISLQPAASSYIKS